MKQSCASSRARQGFTLIELLVVIAIIGILAGLILPTLATAKITTQKKLAKSEMANLIGAINAYQSDYSRLPASSEAVAAATTNDFTFGTYYTVSNLWLCSTQIVSKTGAGYTQQANYQNANSEIMTIIGDYDFRPNNNHFYNPRKTQLFNGKMAASTNSPGLGPDYVLRDPWGNPYIITLDLNYDNKCEDSFYMNINNGVSNSVPGNVMIWSFGPPNQTPKPGQSGRIESWN